MDLDVRGLPLEPVAQRLVDAGTASSAGSTACPGVPAAISTAAIDAAWPTQMVETSFLTYCMVS